MALFEIRAIEQMLVSYEIEANTVEEAVHKLKNREPSDGVRETSSEYYDFDDIYDIHDENGEETWFNA